MPVLITPSDPPGTQTPPDPHIQVHNIPLIHDHRPLAPAQPPHLSRHQPPILLTPGKDYHRVRAREHPLKSRSRESPNGAT
ncbi:hypothetical protein [uncultured Methanoculleus sp.]|uniref:hypothetical protein n=1 Tax=uncultured Methanoculleus sp. TaxID=183762 RepID=UPI003204892A